MTTDVSLPCDICDSFDAVEIPCSRLYTRGQPIHVCKKCGLVSFRKRRTPAELAAYWEEQIFKTGEFTAHNPVFRSRHVYAVEFLNKHLGLKGRRLLDIGAGEGQFLSLARKEGCEVFGVESSKANGALLEKLGLPHFSGTIEDYTASPGAKFRADIVTIIFTLQNSQSCVGMLRTAYDLLADGGHVFIELGARVLVPFKKPLGCYLSTLEQDDQPYHFSINTLQAVLAKAGFRVRATNHYWDEDLMCVIAEKRPAGEQIEWTPDSADEVLAFFARWHEESERMKSYVRILPLEYRLSTTHTFYNRS